MKVPRAGEIIRRKPICEPWIVITIYTYGWLVADLTSTDDPAVSKIILQRDFNNWIFDIDVQTVEIEEGKKVYNGVKCNYNKSNETKGNQIWKSI